MADLLWLPIGMAGGLILASAIWIGTGWLYNHQPKWLARYMDWLNRKAGLDLDGRDDGVQ